VARCGGALAAGGLVRAAEGGAGRSLTVYTLRVFYPGDEHAAHVEAILHTLEVLPRIPELLREHGGCDRISVHFGVTHLFSVDGGGEALPR